MSPLAREITALALTTGLFVYISVFVLKMHKWIK